MSSKINLLGIVSAHFATLKDNRTDRLSPVDIATFYGVPLVFAGICLTSGLTLGTTAVGILIGALSILAGLLVNVLVLLYTVNVVGPSPDQKSKQQTLIIEVNSTLLYAVLVAVVAIIALCIVPVVPQAVKTGMRHDFAAAATFTALIIFLLGNFLLTLLMTLKRLKVLLELRFNL